MSDIATVERREAPLTNVELRAEDDGSVTFSGYAAVFDQEADLGYFREKIAPGAFKRTIRNKADVRFLVNHDGVPLARSKSGTLSLAEDDRGLHVEAKLDLDNPTVRELVSAMRRGDLDQMSFAFAPVKEARDEAEDPPLRILREVKLFDVSAVTFPAYEGTSAEVRAAAEELLRRYDDEDTDPDEPDSTTPDAEVREDPEPLGLPLDYASRRLVLTRDRARRLGVRLNQKDDE